MLFVKNVIKNKKYFYFNKLALVDVTISNEKNLLQQVIYMDNSMIFFEINGYASEENAYLLI